MKKCKLKLIQLKLKRKPRKLRTKDAQILQIYQRSENFKELDRR